MRKTTEAKKLQQYGPQCQRYELALTRLGVRPVLAREAAETLVCVPVSEWSYEQKITLAATIAAMVSKRTAEPKAPAILDDAAKALLAKGLPWTVYEQSIIKRAWYARFKSSFPPRRIDVEGRDVTDLPGLWEETDVYREPCEANGAAFLESRGVETVLAQEASIVLSEKTLPWSEADQNLARAAFSAMLAAEALQLVESLYPI